MYVPWTVPIVLTSEFLALARLVSLMTSNEAIYPVNKTPKILLATGGQNTVKYDPKVTIQRCNGPPTMSMQTCSLVGPTHIVLSLEKVFVSGLYVKNLKTVKSERRP